MRLAAAEARGKMMNIAATISTEKRICIAYCSDRDHRAQFHRARRDAASADVHQGDAGDVRKSRIIIDGIRNAMMRLTDTAVSIVAVLA